MNLYGHPYSGNARRVQMLCEELGVPYTYEKVDLLGAQQYTPEFQALNPNCKVPVIDDDGFLLWESQAIMRYLANKHNASSWYPTELRERARIDQWLDWNQTRLTREVGKIAFNTLFAGDKADTSAIEEGKKNLEKILPVLDAALVDQPYACGYKITLADLALVSNVAYLEMCDYDLIRYPGIKKWYETMKGRPSFTTTAPKG